MSILKSIYNLLATAGIVVNPGAEVLATNQFQFTVTNSSSPQQILPANPNRRALLFQNPDTGNSAWVQVGGTTASVGAPSLKLLPQGSGGMYPVGPEAVWGVTNVASVVIVVTEIYAVGT